MKYTYVVMFSDENIVLGICPESIEGSYTISSSVWGIGEKAFMYCTSLTTITIPNSVTKINVLIFNDCSGLTKINVSTDNTVYASHKVSI